MSHLPLSFINRLSQTGSTLCLQSLVAMFPNDLFFQNIYVPCVKNMLCFYICFSEIVRFCKPTVLTKLSRKA